MIDHMGREIAVGWSDHHIVWIEAAMTLPKNKRTEAFQDIADMTGRSLNAVRCKAYWIEEQRQEDRLRLAAARTRRVLVADPGRGPNRPKLPPSQLEPISKARLMGARA